MKKITIMLLMLFAVGVTSVMAQGRTVSGKVVDSGTDMPIIGATVLVQGSSNGAYTLDGGAFVISNVEGAVSLEVTFMGYTTAIVEVSAAQTNVDIKLTPSAMTMDEVVVIAYGSADKKSISGSVAVISADKLEDRPLTNVANAISGMASGIMTTAASGEPGASSSVRIRGISTINSDSTPLYVVDGMIYHGNISNIAPSDIQSMSLLKDAASTALYGSKAANGVIMIQTKTGRKGKVQFDVKITQGFQYRAMPEYDKIGAMDSYELGWEAKRNELYFTNNQDFDVAGALASDFIFNDSKLYNVLQGSNGLQIPNDQVIMEQAWGSGTNTSWTRGAVNPDASIMDGYAGDFDWLDQITQPGYRQSYNISASGGSEKSSYYTSLGYTDEDGYLANSGMSRLNARAKVDVTPTTWLKLGTNMGVSERTVSNPYGDGDENNSTNPFAFARNISAVYPVHLHDMSTGEYLLDAAGSKIYDAGQGYVDASGKTIAEMRDQYAGENPLYRGENNLNDASTVSLNLSAYAEIKFLKDFKFTIDGSLNNRYEYLNSYINSQIGSSAGEGEATNEANRYLDTDFRQMLEWSRQFGKHNVSALVGHVYSQQKRHYLSANKTGEIFPGSTELDNFATTGDISGFSMETLTETFISRANYNYDEKYYLTASFSRDGISKLSPQNRWGNFWSVGGTWILSSEEFMQNVMWVDFLKARVSFGTNGNSVGIETYEWLAQYTITDYADEAAFDWRWGSGAPQLKWETNSTLDLGVDFRFFNKLNGTIGYYEKGSDELIFDVPVPVSTGINKVKQNIGSMVNRGVELSLDADIVRTKDWVWNVGLNATWQQNRITKLPGVYEESGIEWGDNKKLAIGSSLFEFYLYQFAGIDAEDGASYYIMDPEVTPGNSEFQQDGNWYTKAGSNAYKDFSGDAIAPVFGSVSSSLSWRDLTLDLLFTYQIGGNAIDYAYSGLMTGKVRGAMSADIINSWRKPGDVTALPRIENGGGVGLYTRSSRDLIDNSYLTLQNVTLSYRFPKKVANKLSLNGLSIFASGENLFQISAIKGYDAQSSFDGGVNAARYGTAAIVSVGINVSF